MGVGYSQVAYVNWGQDEGVFFGEIVEYGFVDAKVFSQDGFRGMD